MTLEEAIQEFEDFCYHHSLHHNCCRIQGDHLVFGFCDICNYRGGLCNHVEERR